MKTRTSLEDELVGIVMSLKGKLRNVSEEVDYLWDTGGEWDLYDVFGSIDEENIRLLLNDLLHARSTIEEGCDLLLDVVKTTSRN